MKSSTSNSYMLPFFVTLFTTSFLAPTCWFLSAELERLQNEYDSLHILNDELERAGADLLDEKRRQDTAKAGIISQRDTLQRQIAEMETKGKQQEQEIAKLKEEKHVEEQARQKAEDETKTLGDLKKELDSVRREKDAAEEAKREAEEAKAAAEKAKSKAEQRAHDKEEEARGAEKTLRNFQKQLDEAKAALTKGADNKETQAEGEKPKEGEETKEEAKPKEEAAKPQARRLLWSLLRNS